MRRSTRTACVGTVALLATTLAACGSGDGGGGGGSGDGESWVLGTTESVTALDPAGSYDFGSWNIQYNIYEQLLTIPPGETEPVGSAAESCTYDDPKTITCKLVPGQTFSNGHELTSSDVKFSLQRNIEIADPNGSSVLLGQLSNGDEKNPQLADGAIETPDEQTVVFHLNAPDTTFKKLLSTATTSIVDEETFPADELLPDDQVVGSGAFTLEQYKPGEQATLVANDSYEGPHEPSSDKIFVQYLSEPAALKTAVESGQVDVAWRTLSPTDINDLESSDQVDVVRGEGSEFRYWVWQLGTKIGGNKAIRQAVAHIIDRKEIAQDAYSGTVEPAYSIVPPGFAGQKDSFAEEYGKSPDVDAAKQLLADAGVQTPVDITLGYTPTHYGPNAVDEANTLARQLNDTGLFKATTEDAEWEQYQKLYKENAYDLFILGWYPDILDADNYLTPFLRDGGFYANNYSSKKVDTLLDQELAETDDGAREKLLMQLQDIVAEDVPLIPSWNGENVAVTGPGMEGVEETLDPTYIFRFWDITKSG